MDSILHLVKLEDGLAAQLSELVLLLKRLNSVPYDQVTRARVASLERQLLGDEDLDAGVFDPNDIAMAVHLAVSSIGERSDIRSSEAALDCAAQSYDAVVKCRLDFFARPWDEYEIEEVEKKDDVLQAEIEFQLRTLDEIGRLKG